MRTRIVVGVLLALLFLLTLFFGGVVQLSLIHICQFIIRKGCDRLAPDERVA